jgi:OCT family organic cation transporter-like MFS transporter 18
MVSTANYHELTTSSSDGKPKKTSTINTTVLWVTYVNIALYALSYQLQTPVEPFLIKKLSEEAGDAEGVNRTYGNLQSFFQAIQTIGSPVVGIILDRIGLRYTSALVFLASALCYAILAVAYDLPTLFLSKIPTVFQAAFLVAQATAATSTGNDAAARAAALGRMTTAYTVGATLGPMLGGYLADRGNFYIGAKFAVVGSLISVVLSLVFLTDETNKEEKEKPPSAESTEKEDKKIKKKRSFLNELRHSGGMALRSSLWPLLMVKVLGGVVASMHSTAMPLMLTQKLELEPSQLGLSMSGSMMAVAAFGAVGMAPLTNALGPPRMTYLGLLGRAALGLTMAALVAIAIGHGDAFLMQIISVAIMHALASHTLATGLTTQTTGAVASDERGSLLGLEHSLFSLARIAGPKIATSLLSFGNGMWPVEIACGVSDILLVLALLATASQIAKQKSP